MRYLGIVSFVAAAAILSGCGGRTEAERQASLERQRQNLPTANQGEGSSVFDLFSNDNSDQKIAVNRHLWAASLDVLSFLPIETVDPFSGVIATGWGRVNGASTPYRVTVYISQPALDARSLRVAVFRGGGAGVAVSDDVARQIEDSILTRARQMKMAENNRG